MWLAVSKRRKRAHEAKLPSRAWLLAGAVLLSAVLAGAHSAAHGEDEHACPICLHIHTLIWVPDALPLPAPYLWRPLTAPPAVEVDAVPIVVVRSRGPPFAPH